MEGIAPAPGSRRLVAAKCASMPALLEAAAPAPARKQARFYEPELDVLRFCAFLAVFCFHTLPSDYSVLALRFGMVVPVLLLAVRNSLAFGVCMFFLLSSYLITKLLVLERERTGSIHRKNFYVRRILRIWPLYLVFLFAMWGLGRAGVFYPVETPRLLAFLFFAGNIYSGSFGLTFNPILPLWTISIEEQFYILWPALARGGNRLLRGGAWAIVAISIGAVALIPQFAANPSLALWTSSLVQFQFFALGALLALQFSHRLPTWGLGTRMGFAATGVALVLIAAGPLHINSGGPMVTTPLLVAGYEAMAAGIVLLFLTFLGAAKGLPIVPEPLTYLGKISYGLYVFHDLALQICLKISQHFTLPTGFRAVGAATMTLVLAMLSYKFFETPFLLLKDRFAVVRTRPA